MTRKDFELIAETINAMRNTVKPEHREMENAILDRVAYRFADALLGTNSNFNGYKFLTVALRDSPDEVVS